MIDLHSHILPGVDDGARSIQESLAMARMAVDEGIEIMACTPHFMPGLYDNTSADIRRRVSELADVFEQNGVNLQLVVGSDAHMRPDFVDCLQKGRILTLNDSRYVLFEPPHVVKPKRLDDLLFNIQAAGYVPILTHPERLQWIEQGYAEVVQLAQSGVLVQLTAGSIVGRFGKRAAYWSRRMLAEGLVSIVATDCHNLESRAPRFIKVFDLAQSELGQEEAVNLVYRRAALMLEDAAPDQLAALPTPVVRAQGWWQGLRRALNW